MAEFITALKNVDDMLEKTSGLSLISLFRSVCGYNPEMRFDCQKEEFFRLLSYLLQLNKIKFLYIKDKIYEGDGVLSPYVGEGCNKTYWDASEDVIVSFLKSKWPEDASHEEDLSLTLYFHEMPELMWCL